MSGFIRKIKIIHNRGAVNIGDHYRIEPFTAVKVYTGAGGSSEATFLNGKRTPAPVPTGTEFNPPLETSEVTLGA